MAEELEPPHQISNLLWKLNKKKTDLMKEGASLDHMFLFARSQSEADLEPYLSSLDYQKYKDISKKLDDIKRFIQFCETILQKMKSSKQHDENEQLFLKYVDNVLKIIEMKKKLMNMKNYTESIFDDYSKLYNYLIKKIPERYDAFMIYMDFSECTQPHNSCGKPAGGIQKKSRIRTMDDNDQIKTTDKNLDAEKLRSSTEFGRISSSMPIFLERLKYLSLFVLAIIHRFDLESDPEFYFFLYGFNQKRFKLFDSEFRILDKIFELLKTEIQKFITGVMSEKHVVKRNIDSICPDDHLVKLKECLSEGLIFRGKPN
jgi:hypothetical protein